MIISLENSRSSYCSHKFIANDALRSGLYFRVCPASPELFRGRIWGLVNVTKFSDSSKPVSDKSIKMMFLWNQC